MLLPVASLTLPSPPLWGRFARESGGLPVRGPPQAVGEVFVPCRSLQALRYSLTIKYRHRNSLAFPWRGRWRAKRVG